MNIDQTKTQGTQGFNVVLHKAKISYLLFLNGGSMSLDLLHGVDGAYCRCPWPRFLVLLGDRIEVFHRLRSR
jgi:hypothetical protein